MTLIARNISELQSWRSSKTAVSFVPTMGALHAGHLDLVKKAQELAPQTCVSIFVNPKQFGPAEDFKQYPRTHEDDISKLKAQKVACVFIPSPEEIYPQGFQTSIACSELAQTLCGVSRPVHFQGVCTVVTKLFNLVRPNFAVFGKKDYQQWLIVKQMTKDLNLGIEIIGHETVREPDGLALSSRNQLLTAKHREIASIIFKTLNLMRKSFAFIKDRDQLLQVGKEYLKAEPEVVIDYLSIRKPDLTPADEHLDSNNIIFIAAHLGRVRLIDNIELLSEA